MSAGGPEMGEADADLLVRVRKLLDKAEGTSNSHESEAFSQKAAQLIARHRIDPERLAQVEVNDDLRVREMVLGRGAYVRARLQLLTVIADAHDVRVVFQARAAGTVAMMAGFRSDLDVVEMMYTSLHQQAASQMARERRQTGAATQQFRRSFLFGFSDRLYTLFEESKREVEQTESTDAAAVRTLAVRTRNERIDEFAAKKFGRVRSARRPNPAQAGGWDAGAVAAGRADVGRTRLAGRRQIGPSSG